LSLSDLASLGSFASGVAVTVSLIYLIIQTRQNVRHTRGLIIQGASASTTAIVLANQTRDAMTTWIGGNGGDPTEARIREGQFDLMCQGSVTAMEDLFAQRALGLVPDEVFARNCLLHQALLSQPGMRAYWMAQRKELGEAAPKFVAFVDGLCVGDATEFALKL
jgi:hypothetical protein